MRRFRVQDFEIRPLPTQSQNSSLQYVQHETFIFCVRSNALIEYALAIKVAAVTFGVEFIPCRLNLFRPNQGEGLVT